MKFALNGAITIGTLDGANVEIREEVGAENFFLFGLTVEQVRELKLRGYRPQEVAEKNASSREVLNFIGSGALAGGRPELRPLLDRLLQEDPFLVLADYQAYADCQEQVSALWCDQWGMDTQSNPQRGAYGQVLIPTAPSLTTATTCGG